MKKIIISIVLVTSTIFLTYYIYYNNYSNKGIIVNSTTRSTIIDSSTLSMMLETNFNSGMYEVSSDTSWPGTGCVFNETLSKCSKGGTISYDKDTNTVYFSGVSKDYCYVYFDLVYTIDDICDTGDSLSECIKELYNETGEGTVNIYYHDGVGNYTNSDLEAKDYSYRYSGSGEDVLNYVCFGSDDCTDLDNLYRIIGIFQNDTGDYEVKLIKYDYCTSEMCGETWDYYGTYTYGLEYYLGYIKSSIIGSYTWNYSNYDNTYSQTNGYYNSWNYSDLNNYNLNNVYYNNLKDSWKNLITTHTWIVGGNTMGSLLWVGGSYGCYNFEIDSPSTEVESTNLSNIGLMYLSDYYYSASIEYWNYQLYKEDGNDYRITGTDNWMYMGLMEWSITRITDNNYQVMGIYDKGYGYFGNVYDSASIRPTFYLTSSVEYSSGSGTPDDPIILITE